jgi:anhydro-N-acetylmuramic acid kinase
MPDLFIGLMSGTSADGIDAALVEIDAARVRLRHACHSRFPAPLQAGIHALARGNYGDRDAIEWLGALDARLGEAFADAALQIIGEAGVDKGRIRAIGSHGHTIRHRPDESSPFTLQIGDPNIVAARTGVTTVADFRRRDVALGGQGAPLAPAFHQAIFGSADETRVVLNLGGIANVTLLDPARETRGFDTGPANTLLDAWASRHGRGPFDNNGAFARTGHFNAALLAALLDDAYFKRPPPKSSGLERFNPDWLDAQLARLAEPVAAADVQATLVELTARSVANEIATHAPSAQRVYACGGGVHNPALMTALGDALGTVTFESTAIAGADPDYIEAMAFAWLASRALTGKPGNLPAVTGAREAATLGTICPGPAGKTRPGETYSNSSVSPASRQ